MYALLNKFLRREDGIAVTELAVVTPVFLLMFLSTIELGNMIYTNINLEKALRSAVTYAGRIELHDAQTIQNTKNIVMTGNPSGTGPYLLPGWSDPDASVIFVQNTYFQTLAGADMNEVVTSVTADVPYVPIGGVVMPILEFLLKRNFKKGKVFITLTHEQAIIGN